MNELLIFSGIVFMGFFSIMNPIAGIPIFLTLTACNDEYESKQIAFKAVLTAFLVVCVFAIAGHIILKMFGVSFTALKLTGGIIVLLIGYDMLQGNQSQVSRPTSDTINKAIKEEVSVAFAPLAVPLLSGPGVIITAMNFASNGIMKLFITLLMFGLLCIITYFSFISGKKIKKVIGTSTLKVITRMMGLILAVIGVQMFLEGVYSAIREFKF